MAKYGITFIVSQLLFYLFSVWFKNNTIYPYIEGEKRELTSFDEEMFFFNYFYFSKRKKKNPSSIKAYRNLLRYIENLILNIHRLFTLLEWSYNDLSLVF